VNNIPFKEKPKWAPTKPEGQKARISWLRKQARQRNQTLKQKGVTHTPERVTQLKDEAKWFREEAKRLKDYMEDGR